MSALRSIYANAGLRLEQQLAQVRMTYQHVEQKTVRLIDKQTMPRRIGRLIDTPLTAKMFDEGVLQELRSFHTMSDLSGKAQLQLERVVGKADYLPAWFLQRGAELRRTVAQVRARAPSGVVMSGTGFLVGPGLLLTNAHVLDWTDMDGPGIGQIAPGSLAVFDYEDLHTGAPGASITFALEPQHVLMSSPWNELDYALVAVASMDTSGAHSVMDFGFNRLSSDLGKIAIGEPVYIIQHPQGQPKQVVLSDNRLIKRDDADPYLAYEADTDSGSSGSPVFNGQWEVVALHHAPQIARDNEGRILSKTGAAWNDTMDVHDIKFLDLNEGIRISLIVQHIRAVLQSNLQNDTAVQHRISDAGRIALKAMLATSDGTAPVSLIQPIPISKVQP